MTQDEILHIYTDGSLKERKAGGWAYVICGPDHHMRGVGHERTASSYRTELLGVVHALACLQSGATVLVHSDCMGLVDRINELGRVPQERRTDAVRSRWKEQDLWQELALLLTQHDVRAVWTPRRSEFMADKVHHLCRAAADRGRG